jgi:hypothetical protein
MGLSLALSFAYLPSLTDREKMYIIPTTTHHKNRKGGIFFRGEKFYFMTMECWEFLTVVSFARAIRGAPVSLEFFLFSFSFVTE